MGEAKCDYTTPLSLSVNQDSEDITESDGDIIKANIPFEGVNIGLKRQLGLLSLVSFLVGSIIGSGIFASPRSVATYSGNVL